VTDLANQFGVELSEPEEGFNEDVKPNEISTSTTANPATTDTTSKDTTSSCDDEDSENDWVAFDITGVLLGTKTTLQIDKLFILFLIRQADSCSSCERRGGRSPEIF
jgi:hypothetical protein